MGQYQYLGWIAIAFYVIAPFCKIPRNTIKIHSSGQVFNIVLYTLSMQWVAALSITLNTLRGICAIYASDKVLRYAMILSLSVVWGATLYYIKFPYDILIALAATSVAMSQKMRDHFYGFRLFTFTSQALWCTHSLLTEMYTMTVTTSMLMVINVCTVSYYTYKAYKDTGTFNVSASQ